MTQKFFSQSQIKLALSIDGFQYTQKNQNFSLRDILEEYWNTKSWNHVSLIEGRATLFLIFKAIEAWENSPYSVSQEELAKYYDAFHSLYKWIINPKNKKVVVCPENYLNFKINSVDTFKSNKDNQTLSRLKSKQKQSVLLSSFY